MMLPLDDVIEALRSALLTAQRALHRRQQVIWRQSCEPDGHGALRSKMLRFSLPSGEGESDYESVVVPLLSLRDHKVPHLAEIRLGFDCEITLVPPAPGQAARYRMRLTGKRWWQPWVALHHVEISVNVGEAPVGKVTVDGMLLKEMPWSTRGVET